MKGRHSTENGRGLSGQRLKWDEIKPEPVCPSRRAMHSTGAQKRLCLSHGQNHYHDKQVLPGFWKGRMENASPSVQEDASPRCRVGVVLPGRCLGRISSCSAGWACRAVMDDSVPGVPRVTVPVTGALIICCSGPLLCGVRRSLGRHRSAASFVLRGERGAETFPGLSPSASCARLKACEGTHSPACAGRCCLNGFGL